MQSADPRGWIAVAALLACLLAACDRPLDGPQPVAWDRVACSHCGMLVSERGFAAQLHTTDGRVLHFDDPGCLMLHDHEDAAALWFHDRDEETWHDRDAVVFVNADHSPMGYGLAARAQGATVGLSLSEATALVRALEAERRGAE